MNKANPRLLLKGCEYGSIVDACFDHLRLYAQTNIYVSLEILMAIRKALPHAKHQEFKVALQQKAKLIIDQLNLDGEHKSEQSIVNENYKLIMSF